MCSNVAGSALTPATCIPPLCAKAFLPTYGWSGSGTKLRSSSRKCDASVSPVSVGQALVAHLELEVRDDRDEVGVAAALAVAVHRPLHHRRAGAHARRASWRRRTPRRRGSGCRPGVPSAATTAAVAACDLVRAATRRSCRTASPRRRPPRRRRARSAARRRGRRASRRRSARRRRRPSCPRRRGRRRTPRSCAGSRRGRRARPSRGAGPRSCRRACRRARSELGQQPQRRVVGRRATSRRRVIPNAAISAVRNVSRASSSNSSASLGFEAGKPASIIGTPRSSSRCATRSFSSADSDMPSPCIPSRRVQS